MILLQNFLPGLSGSDAPADSTLSKTAKDIQELKSLSFDDLIERLAQDLVTFSINLAISIVVFYIGRFIIRKIYKLLSTIFLRRRVDQSLSTFVLSLVNILLYFILITIVIGILGIETTSFLAIFASAGVAIGMALSGTLQNFAGGVLILILKPYKIGDYIEAQGYAGTVREIQIFSTIITTYDNKSISIPNGGLSTGSVNNWSREDHRRVTWNVSISYGDSVSAARLAILKMFAEDERIERGNLDEAIAKLEAANGRNSDSDCTDNDTCGIGEEEQTPAAETAESQQPVEKKRSIWQRVLHRHRAVKDALDTNTKESLKAFLPKVDYSPKVLLNEMGASSVDLQIRAWTRTSLYWNVFYYYNEKFYNELPEHGIHFPFPQLDVHLEHTQPQNP